jgi:hypothetical protein
VILAYCIVADPQLSAPVAGVGQRPVQEITHERLRCFYSWFEEPPQQFNKEDALQFYATVEACFQHTAVIPFRFPTLVQSETELRQFVREKSAAYAAALDKLQNMVQMELRIASEPSLTPQKAPSGKQYLGQRVSRKQALEAAATAARSALRELARDWRQRETPEGLRCYALVARKDIPPFREKLKNLQAEKGLQTSVSGPWPAAEFIE